MMGKLVAQVAQRTASMAAGLEPASAFCAGSRGNGAVAVWKRFLNVHEYQGANQMSKFGVNVPPGIVAFSVPEAVEAAKKMEKGSGEVREMKILFFLYCFVCFFLFSAAQVFFSFF